jgi:hypothetical protein
MGGNLQDQSCRAVRQRVQKRRCMYERAPRSARCRSEPTPPGREPSPPSPPSPPSRTDRTRLVPSPVLTGHVSSLPPYQPDTSRPFPRAAAAAAARVSPPRADPPLPPTPQGPALSRGVRAPPPAAPARPAPPWPAAPSPARAAAALTLCLSHEADVRLRLWLAASWCTRSCNTSSFERAPLPGRAGVAARARARLAARMGGCRAQQQQKVEERYEAGAGRAGSAGGCALMRQISSSRTSAACPGAQRACAAAHTARAAAKRPARRWTRARLAAASALPGASASARPYSSAATCARAAPHPARGPAPPRGGARRWRVERRGRREAGRGLGFRV